MKYHLRFGIVVWLICSALLFAQSNPSSSEQKQESPASNSNTQEPRQTEVEKTDGNVAVSGDKKNPRFGSLDGTWEGDLVFLQEKEPLTRRYRITIQGSSVRVYGVYPQDVEEIKPGKFHIDRVMTNAAIYASDSAHDNEGTWVETQVLAVTLKNGTTLLTNFSRVVNNLDLPLASDHSKFTEAAVGEFNLIETPPPVAAKLQSPTALTPQAAFGSGAMSATSALNQAARAAAVNRGGDYGLGTGSKATAAFGPVEVLTDTKGVDFGPYLQRVIHDVNVVWYNHIPESARAPVMKKGKVTIEFAVLKNGTVAGMKLVSTSGDVALDRGAWTGIAESSPFPPLPSEFGGPYLGVRFTFYYNPDKADLMVR
jgi:TonB family protein